MSRTIVTVTIPPALVERLDTIAEREYPRISYIPSCPLIKIVAVADEKRGGS